MKVTFAQEQTGPDGEALAALQTPVRDPEHVPNEKLEMHWFLLLNPGPNPKQSFLEVQLTLQRVPVESTPTPVLMATENDG